ncbi:MAG: hypothetical protein QOE08_1215 [Thermoleophilaceae bacterium]|nr:hypothetical protein [Thermoleophilaceae bacterium]
MQTTHQLTGAIAAETNPAGGAAVIDLVGAAVAGALLTAAVLWLAMAHRSGRITWLGRLAAFSGRVSGLPAWAALPAVVAGTSMIVAVSGFYWDVAKHIDSGRDASPFGTPAHYPILAGLIGIALGGFLTILLAGERKPSATSVRIAEGWYAPLGGVLILACGLFSLAGFPLDDLWHRLFGQDVTLWGPTHVIMIAGGSLTTLGLWVLLTEGLRARPAGAPAPEGVLARPVWVRARNVAIAGGFLLGLSSLQGEFDYGVPQFQLVYQPVMLMLAAGAGLVTARIVLGRFGALQAALFFVLLKGTLTLLIGPVLGDSTQHFPLYIAEALLVEIVALRVRRDRPIALGAASGVAIGTIGLAAEWGWSHVWMPLPWPASLLPEAAILGFAAAVASGVIGGFIGRALAGGAASTSTAPRWLLPAAGLVTLFCIAHPLPMTSAPGQSATFTLSEAQPPPDRKVNAIVQLSPPDAARDADWLTVSAWQGGGLVVDRLKQIGPGRYRTTKPIPVSGEWKAMLRLEKGRRVVAAPLFLPDDKAIPAKGVAAQSGVTRALVADKKILQRESRAGSSWLTLPAYLLMLAIAAVWIVALTWGLRRLERGPRRRAAAAAVGERKPAPLPAFSRHRPA